MRWLLFFLVVIGGLWYLRGIEEMPPPKAEDSFIGEQVKVLNKAKNYEQVHLENVDAHKKRMEEQLEKDAGG